MQENAPFPTVGSIPAGAGRMLAGNQPDGCRGAGICRQSGGIVWIGDVLGERQHRHCDAQCGSFIASHHQLDPDRRGSGNIIDFLPVGQTENFTVSGPVAGTAYSVLNRILPASGNPQAGFFGSVTSDPNVRVWLYSPGGLLIGSTATSDVGGLVLTAADPATTLDIATGAVNVRHQYGRHGNIPAGGCGRRHKARLQSARRADQRCSLGRLDLPCRIRAAGEQRRTISVNGSSALVAGKVRSSRSILQACSISRSTAERLFLPER